jgi:hypothetical protein
MPLGKKRFGGDGLLYVVLSRVPSLLNLFLCERMSEDVQRYKKRAAVVQEVQRIRAQLVRPTTKRMDDLFASLGLASTDSADVTTRKRKQPGSASSAEDIPDTQSQKRPKTDELLEYVVWAYVSESCSFDCVFMCLWACYRIAPERWKEVRNLCCVSCLVSHVSCLVSRVSDSSLISRLASFFRDFSNTIESRFFLCRSV